MKISHLPTNMQTKIAVTPEGCWAWTAATARNGYGQIAWGGQTRSSHRVAYFLLVGPVPFGLDLDHLCRNKLCCNPAHLEPVTRREHAKRSLSATSPICRHGHPLTGDNLRMRADGRRVCRTCQSTYMSRYNEAHSTK